MTDSAPLLILGTGLAGYHLAKEFRKLDADRPLCLVTADDGRSYSKPMLSTGFAKNKAADDLAMQSAETMAEQLNATIITETRVTGIDPATRRVLTTQGQLAYSDLVLASGAEARRLPWADVLGERLLSINDLGDYARFRAAVAGKRDVVIVGAGLIGCEYANDLAAAGYSVQVIAPDQQVMAGLLPPEVAEAVQSGLEAIGVRFHLGQGIRDMRAGGKGVQATLEDGTLIEAEQGLSAIGLVPGRALAEQAGLEVAHGVKVDRRLRTSAEHIFALGDCAEVGSLSLMYVMPLMAAARVLAQNLAGGDAELSYGPMPITVKTPACPLVVSPPLTSVGGSWTVSGEGLDRRALFHDESGQLHGYALTGAAVSEKLQLNRQLPAWMP